MNRVLIKKVCNKCAVRFLSILLTMGCTALTAVPLLGAQGIHNAVLDGDIAAVQQALDDGADLDGYNLVGFAPLHSAARGGYVDIVRLLLDNGALPSIRTRTEDEDTPLHIATLNGREALVELLIAAGAEINAQNASGNAPIHEAATFGSPAIARALLDAGADSEITNLENQTASDVNKEVIEEAASRDRSFFRFNIPLSLSYAATFDDLSTPSSTDIFALLHVDSAYQFLFSIGNSTEYGMFLGPEIGISASASAVPFFVIPPAGGLATYFIIADDAWWWLATLPIAGLLVIPTIFFADAVFGSLSGHIPVRLVYNIDFGGVNIDFLFGPQFNIGVLDTSLTVDIGVRLAAWFGLFFDVIYALPFSVDLVSGAVYDGYWDNALRVGIGYRFEL